ncbi:MAG: molybdopterin-dependent oxidoreductase [Gammaproteobacteria bacterium]
MRPGEIGAALAAVTRAAAESAQDAALLGALGDVAVDDAARAIAAALRDAEHAYVIAAGDVERSAQRADWLNRCAAIAQLTGSRLGELTDGANAAGAWLAGAVPHRGPAGRALSAPGKPAGTMLAEGLEACILLGIEPERDFADVPAALAALGRARVVALTAFATPALLETAQVLLPIAAFGENEGSFVNATGLWQDFGAAVKPPGEARAAWKVLRVLGERLGLDGFDAVSVAAVGAELKTLVGEHRPVAREAAAQRAPMTATVAGLERLDVPALYAGDALVRRAPALQATVGAADDKVRVSTATAAALGLADGARVTVSAGAAQASAALMIDDAVPAQTCVIHAGSALAAQLPASTSVKLGGAR